MNAIRYKVGTVLFILLILLSGISPTMNAMIAPVTYSVRGKVIDRQSRQPVAYANVFVAGIPGKGASTDSLGTFKIEQVPPGIYSLEASCIGYQTVSTPEYIVSASTPFIEIEMEEDANLLNTVVVVPSPFRRNIESPVSMRIIGLQEIEKSPGYNNDSDYRKTNIIQKKIKVKRHIFPVHKYELAVHAVNKHTIKLRYPELEVINQDKCKYAQNQHGCIFKVVAIDVFPEYQFPVPPATVSLQSHGCNTWLQSLPERKKTAAKSQFGNTSGEISLSKSK